jgi:hypothetical protein
MQALPVKNHTVLQEELARIPATAYEGRFSAHEKRTNIHNFLVTVCITRLNTLN